MSPIETINDLFDKAIGMENAAEEIYRRLSKMFSEDADITRFWNRFADEEKGHASYLTQLRARLTPDFLSSPGNVTMLELARKRLANSTDRVLSGVKNLDDAYQIAVELENSETNVVFEFMLSNFPVDELMKTQRFLRIQLSKHAAIEKEFPSKYRSLMVRQRILPASKVVL